MGRVLTESLCLQAVVVEEGKASVAEDPEAVKSEWFAALRTGDVVKVTELLDKGLVDVNATDEVRDIE